jgi:tripartite-type tricarboxylate transporter receptor subunit TctC
MTASNRTGATIATLLFKALLAAVAIGAAAAASAQTYPNKPIRIITSEIGGGSDFVTRLVVQGIGNSLGQPLVIDNRGGNNTIPGGIVVQAPPDGYTLLLNNSGVLIAPLMQDEPRYNPTKDFGFVTYVAGAPNLLVVHPSVPAKSVQELVALAKSKPGTLNFASGGPGTSNHIAAELFKHAAAIDIVHVPFKGTGPALNGLMGAQVQIMVPPVNAVTGHIKAGRLTGLAVTSAKPTPLAPNYPTVASAGLRGYEAVSMYGVYVPARTPRAIINRLNQEIVQAVHKPDIKEKLFAAGTEAVGSTPEEFAALARSEIARVGKVLKAAGVRGG